MLKNGPAVNIITMISCPIPRSRWHFARLVISIWPILRSLALVRNFVPHRTVAVRSKVVSSRTATLARMRGVEWDGGERCFTAPTFECNKVLQDLRHLAARFRRPWWFSHDTLTIVLSSKDTAALLWLFPSSWRRYKSDPWHLVIVFVVLERANRKGGVVIR
jgi:hypothetical protein